MEKRIFIIFYKDGRTEIKETFTGANMDNPFYYMLHKTCLTSDNIKSYIVIAGEQIKPIEDKERFLAYCNRYLGDN